MKASKKYFFKRARIDRGLEMGGVPDNEMMMVLLLLMDDDDIKDGDDAYDNKQK